MFYHALSHMAFFSILLFCSYIYSWHYNNFKNAFMPGSKNKYLFFCLVFMSIYINSIGTAVPQHKIAQSDIVRFMAKAHQMNDAEKRRLVALYRASGIRSRHSVLPDFGQSKDFTFFPEDDEMEAFPSTRKRMEVYHREAPRLSLAAIQHCLDAQQQVQAKDITHLICVSCTGMYAPGLDIDIIQGAGIPSHVQRSCINFMGCYAAFNALKSAYHIIRSEPQAKVLIVCTELCTLHFQRDKNEDNLLSNALFADGSAAVLLSAEALERTTQLSLENFYCDLAPEGSEEMSWHISDFGFQMKLSAHVPGIIQKGIRQLTESLFEQLSDDNKLRQNQAFADYYAIHPGGKRILKVIEEALDMRAEDNAAAYEVLRNYGNMSSPTVLFVLWHLWQGFDKSDDQKSILSFAFGPGLTMESMLLRIHSR